MTPRLACADFTFPLLPHDKSLDLIAMLGFEGVDIGLFEGRSHLWPSRVFGDLKASARELAGKLRDRGLALADLFLQTAPDFVSLAPNHPDASIRRQARDWFERTVEFALECGGRHVSALPGVHFEGVPEAESSGRCHDELAWRCETAKGQGVTFSVEAHVGSIVPTPDSAARLVRVGPRAVADAGLHPLHPERPARLRGGTLDRSRQPLPRPRRPAGPAPGIAQGERHRLRTRPRRHAASRLRGLRRRRIRLDRLGALQRGRQPVGDHPDARLAPQPPDSPIMNQPDPALGVILHAIGGLASASFYLPFRGVKGWSWESYWLVGGVFSWVFAPWLFALVQIPDLCGFSARHRGRPCSGAICSASSGGSAA